MNSDRIEAEREADNRIDARMILLMFVSMVLGAAHFISGWTF